MHWPLLCILKNKVEQLNNANNWKRFFLVKLPIGKMWEAMMMRLWFYSENSSGTYEFFKEHVMSKRIMQVPF